MKNERRSIIATEQVTIWKWGYFPFTLGGKVHRLIKCTVEAEGPVDLGGGYSGYVVVAPTGRTYVAEASSGGLVGPSVEEVRDDIRKGDPHAMQEQIEAAKVKLAKAQEVSVDRFWGRVGDAEDVKG